MSTAANSTTAPAPRRGLLDYIAGCRLVAARELGAYFDSAIAYVVIVAFALLANSIFMNEFFLAGQVEMTAFFQAAPFLLTVFLPAITMRLWAEETRQRTAEFLLTLPLTPGQAVLGKYAAAFALFGLFLVATLPIPVMLFALGEPDAGRIFSGYLGVILFGAMLLALGELMSALSRDQIVAFVLSVLTGALLVLTGAERVVGVLDGLAPALGIGTFLYESVSAMPRYETLIRGVVELSTLLYFVGLSAAALALTSWTLKHDRG